jgi:GNAT superfamily N-acetyltransferase
MPPKARAKAPKLAFAPATPDRWVDIETLFGPRGACAGCWCMWWRLTRGEFQKNAGAGNRLAFKKLVDGGAAPGVLAYDAGRPVGWCAVQPKEAYASLARSRTKTIDANSTPTGPAWSVTCFFIAKDYRGRGLSLALLNAAVAHARRQGARLIEGYPIDTDKRAMDFSSFMGTAQVFAKAGFAEAARQSPNRPIMRLEIRR